VKRALLGIGLGVVLSRVGLAGSEGVIRGLDGQDLWLPLLGLLALVLHSHRRNKLYFGWKREVGAGVLLGVGIGLLGALPITLAASLGEGRLLALPLLAVCYAGWHFAGRWDLIDGALGDRDLSETAPEALPAPGRSADVRPDSGRDSAV
jgi:hypothetical protein